jgi:hypothetical protein
MKNKLKLFYLLIAVTILFFGCQKSELNDNSTNNDGEKTTPVYCGTPMVTNIYELSQDSNLTQGTTSYGTVTIVNDAQNLYVTYDLIDGWEINYELPEYKRGAHLFVGTQAQLIATHTNPDVQILSENTVHLWEGKLPYAYVPSGAGVNVYTFTIPRNSITIDCPTIVAIVDIRNTATGVVKHDLSARANTKCYAYYFQYCMQSCGGNETAYAKADNGTCFLTLPNVNSNNWGWSNLVSAPGTYYWPIWAGAGQCNTGNATEAGKLKVIFDGANVTVSYNLYGGYHLDETHLWVGKDYLPKKNNKYVTAPGQFGHTQTGLNGASTYTYASIPITAPFYIAAHSVVYW